jgi:hypothetical protein
MAVTKKRRLIKMKKAYETPSVEVVKFRYSDQVVASSGDSGSWCMTSYARSAPDGEICTEQSWRHYN